MVGFLRYFIEAVDFNGQFMNSRTCPSNLAQYDLELQLSWWLGISNSPQPLNTRALKSILSPNSLKWEIMIISGSYQFTVRVRAHLPQLEFLLCTCVAERRVQNGVSQKCPWEMSMTGFVPDGTGLSKDRTLSCAGGSHGTQPGTPLICLQWTLSVVWDSFWSQLLFMEVFRLDKPLQPSPTKPRLVTLEQWWNQFCSLCQSREMGETKSSNVLIQQMLSWQSEFAHCQAELQLPPSEDIADLQQRELYLKK